MDMIGRFVMLSVGFAGGALFTLYMALALAPAKASLPPPRPIEFFEPIDVVRYLKIYGYIEPQYSPPPTPKRKPSIEMLLKYKGIKYDR